MPYRTKIRGEGRAHRARGGEEKVPAPSGHNRRARGSWRVVQWGGAGRGGAGRGAARLSRGPHSYCPQGEALERSESCGTSRSCRGPQASARRQPRKDEGAPRGRETLPSSPARKGPAVLSCLVAPPSLLSVTRSPRSAPREAAAPRAARLSPGQRYS